MITSDVDEDKDIPSLADALYHIYSIDGLMFTVNAIQKLIDFMDQLYPSTPKNEKDKMIQVLELEIIVKFCQCAENVGAFAIAFTDTYRDSKTEVLGLFSKISTYSVGEVVNFYAYIGKRD